MRIILAGALSIIAFSGASSTEVFRNPSATQKTYSVSSVLGEGRWGIVYKVKTNTGALAAMKVDKFEVSIDDPNIEAVVLRALKDRNVVPNYIDSFIVPETEGKGKRFIVTELVGSTAKSVMKQTGKPLTEFTAASIGLQTIEALKVVHAAGYYHMDVQYDNLAFKDESKKDRVVLLDLGNAKPVEQNSLFRDVLTAFSVENVFSEFVKPPGETEESWFKWAMKDTREDQSAFDLIDGRSWSPEARVAIRNCRIISRIGRSRFSDLSLADSAADLYNGIALKVDEGTEESWFKWAILDADDEQHIRGYVEARMNRPGKPNFTEAQKRLILNTFAVAKWFNAEFLRRKELARCVKAVLQMLAIGDPEEEEVSWFFDGLLKRHRSDIAGFVNGHGAVRPEVVELTEFAWDVMRGVTEPDYSSMTGILHRMITKHGKMYRDKVLW